MAAEFIIADQRPEGSSTQHSVAFVMHLLEGRALVKLRSLAQVFQQISLGDVEDLDFQHGRGFGLEDKVFQPAPRRFELLKRLGMHDFVQLVGQRLVNGRDARVEHGFGVSRNLHFVGDHLLHQCSHPLFRGIPLLIGRSETSLSQDLVQ